MSKPQGWLCYLSHKNKATIENHNRNGEQTVDYHQFIKAVIITTMSKLPKIHPELFGNKKTHQSEVTLYPLEADFVVKECRICLVSQQSNDQAFISPCECSGTLKYVHKGCLREWLQAKVRKQPVDVQESMKKIACELCKYEIEVKMTTTSRCFSRKRICDNIEQRAFLFVICMIGVVFSLAMLLYSASMMSVNLVIGGQPFSAVDNSLYIVSIVINSLLFIFFLFHIAPYFIDKKVEVSLCSQ